VNGQFKVIPGNWQFFYMPANVSGDIGLPDGLYQQEGKKLVAADYIKSDAPFFFKSLYFKRRVDCY
jgi:hypothetical protein